MKRLMVLLVLVSAPLSLSAQELVSRKGFLIGLGPLAGYETSGLERFGGGLELRIGGAFNEETLLYYESSSFFTQRDGNEITQFDMQAKFQYFAWGNNYLDVGAGTSGGETCQNDVCSLSSVGFGFSGGAGHEFRLTQRFALSPEVTLNYRRLDGVNYFTGGILLHCGWYF